MGLHKFTIEGDVYRVNGKTGEVDGAEGSQNKTMRAPIGEHVKNLLRGRHAWGLRHGLQEAWAELPRGQMVLTGAAAMPGPAAKRVRRGVAGGPVRMANLA